MTVGAQAKITEADTHAMYNGNQFYRIAVARFTPKTVAGSRVQGAHGLGIYIPDNAIVTKAYYHVVEQPTSANSLAQIAIHVNAANDIQTATVITDAKFTAGIKAGIPVGTAATMIKTTAKREITATVSVEDLTAAGIINIYVEYVLTSTA
jgi:hypothetical protein